MTSPTMVATETMVGSSRGVGLWIAPQGQATPTSLTADFGTPWLPLGYASDDGVTVAGDMTTEQFVPWQSTTPVKSVVTERSLTIAFTMWQFNATTVGLYFDTQIDDGTGDIEWEMRGNQQHQYHSIAVDAQDGDRRLRLIFPRATLDAAGDLTLTKGTMTPLEVTLTALEHNGTMGRGYVGATPSPVRGDLASAEQRASGRGGGRRSAPAPESYVSLGK